MKSQHIFSKRSTKNAMAYTLRPVLKARTRAKTVGPSTHSRAGESRLEHFTNACQHKRNVQLGAT